MAGQGYQVGKGFTINPAVPNPTAALQLTNNATGGTLPAATYYIKFTFITANGETAPYVSEQTLTTTGTTSSILFNLGNTYYPTGATGCNIYVSNVSGLESYQGQIATVGGSFTLTSLATNGRPIPQWNLSSYQDINPSVISLGAGTEFIITNLYYNNPVAFGVWDGTTLTMFDGDTGNGSREKISRRCNGSQWIRAYNQASNSTLNVSFDGVQSQ
jgi:hypothetical protein